MTQFVEFVRVVRYVLIVGSTDSHGVVDGEVLNFNTLTALEVAKNRYERFGYTTKIRDMIMDYR